MPVVSNSNSLIGPSRFGAPTLTTNLGGPYQGYSPQQTAQNCNHFGDIMTRSILRNSWNSTAASAAMNGYSRIITPFRAVNNSGDFLARLNYSCGGSNQTNINRPGMRSIIGSVPQQCDGTGVPVREGSP